MKKTKSRILASFVAVMLCFTAFSTVAFANGNDPAASKILRMQTKMPLIRQKPKP